MVFYHHKPLTGMYDDNYRYGTSLYGGNDVERNYRTTLSKTQLRSDRGDLGLYSFAGSNLHGGRPANEKITGVKTSSGTGTGSSYAGTGSTNKDLYAPINPMEYGRGYYDHLRATTPEPRTRSSKLSYDPDLLMADEGFKPSYYQTSPTKISTDYGGDLKTTTKTTIQERWVPLTTHIYNTPYHTYYYRASPFSSYTYRTADGLYDYSYADDYKRYSSTKTTSKNIDALDLSVSSKTDYSHYSEKCQEIQKSLDEVNKWVYDAEMKIKNDVQSSRSKLESELAEVTLIVDDTARYNEDLYRAIKKQAKQISKLNTQYDDMSRNLTEISDVLEKSRIRCQSLQSDLSSVQSNLEMTSKRSSHGTKTVKTTFIYE